MSISSFFHHIFGGGRPSAAKFIESGGVATDFREAKDKNLQMSAMPMLFLAQGLQKADPKSLSTQDRAQLHDALKGFLDSWKARSPAEITVQPTCWYENTQTGEKKWNAPFEGLDSKGELNAQSFQQSFNYLANQAAKQFGFTDLASSKADIQLTQVPYDSFHDGRGTPPPDAVKVSIRFS